ncbi:MAG: BNR-4 repeat-containing protein [Planctomycetota bacterium]|nr:BNR-4 repeat-containing protein [Planctomycetota bacterium]
MIRYSKPFLLSDHGSNRATAYCYNNKIVTLAGKTHVVWTDTVAETRGRTFDHATNQWGPTIHIGTGVDNHNNPSLTADREGRLRIAFGPHGSWANYPAPWPAGAFKWSAAPEINSLEGLGTTNVAAGYNGTYAYLLHDHAGADCLVYRGGDGPPSLMFQRQRKAGGWTNARALMTQDIPPGYTHIAPSLLSEPSGTIYVAGHFYSTFNSTSIGVAILKSADLGETWADMTGKATSTPIEYGSRFAIPHPPAQDDPRNWGMALDPAGSVWAMAGKQGNCGRYLPLSRWAGTHWDTVDVGHFLPADRLPNDGSMSIDSKGRIHVLLAAASIPAGANEKANQEWGDPTCEVFHLCSRDAGKTFECVQVSPTDAKVAHWLPQMSRSGPNYTFENPMILYTRGEATAKPGEGCQATGLNEVWAVRVEAMD